MAFRPVQGELDFPGVAAPPAIFDKKRRDVYNAHESVILPLSPPPAEGDPSGKFEGS